MTIQASARGLTVALVVRNEEMRIERALSSLLPGPLNVDWEILVIDNGSIDQTRAVVEKFRALHPKISLRWLDHHPNNLGAARALAAREARFHVIAFLDGDCEAPYHWAQKSYAELLSHESDPKFFAIGSGNYPPSNRDSFNHALAAQQSSWLGHLNTPQGRLRAKRELTSHLPTCNVFYWREKLLALGNFSSEFDTVCEDLELSRRARGQGFDLYYFPGTEVIHHHRVSLAAWAKKMFRYGHGQMQLAAIYPSHLWGLKGLPLLALALGLVIARKLPLLALGLFLFYALITALLSGFIALRARRFSLAPRIFLIFVSTHLFYAAGEAWGVGREAYRRIMQKRKGEKCALLAKISPPRIL